MVFIQVYLSSSYNQSRIMAANFPKTIFMTGYTHYEFLVMSFGSTNAPLDFMDFIVCVFRPYIDLFIIVFIDENCVYSESRLEHPQCL